MDEIENEKTTGLETAELLYRLEVMWENAYRLYEGLAAMVEGDEPADVERLRRFEAAEAAVQAAGRRAMRAYGPEWRYLLLEAFDNEDEDARDLIDALTKAAESAAAKHPTKRAA